MWKLIYDSNVSKKNMPSKFKKSTKSIYILLSIIIILAVGIIAFQKGNSDLDEILKTNAKQNMFQNNNNQPRFGN